LCVRQHTSIVTENVSPGYLRKASKLNRSHPQKEGNLVTHKKRVTCKFIPKKFSSVFSNGADFKRQHSGTGFIGTVAVASGNAIVITVGGRDWGPVARALAVGLVV